VPRIYEARDDRSGTYASARALAAGLHGGIVPDRDQEVVPMLVAVEPREASTYCRQDRSPISTVNGSGFPTESRELSSVVELAYEWLRDLLTSRTASRGMWRD